MSISKIGESLGDAFEIKNGIIGVNRDVMFQLIELIYFKPDKNVQNLIGMSGECVLWLNHFHYPFYTIPRPNLKRKAIPNLELEKKKLVDINNTNIVFKFKGTEDHGSVFLNLLVKKMILECTIKIEFKGNLEIYIGISTPFQLSKAMLRYIGLSGCGACLRMYQNFSCIMCEGKRSRFFKEGGMKNGESLIAIIDQKDNNNSSNGGKMNFIRYGKKIPHTITNIPSSGVFLGFSSYNNSFTLHITSLRKLRVPLSPTQQLTPTAISRVDGGDDSSSSGGGDGSGVMKCIAYDFNGEFETYSLNYQDEEGKKILNVKEYYQY